MERPSVEEMSSKDDLEFHDSGGPEDVLYEQSDGHTHTFTNFPDSAVDDEEEGDKAQLLKEGEEKKTSYSFWTFEYYQQFFDVETYQVMHRVVGSMLPRPNKNHLQTNIRPNPDLYGPFWICTTLVFTTAIAGNLANYLSSAGKDYQWRYDFHQVTFAATAIFSYWWLLPACIYGVLWWRKSQAGFTFLEILCVYGYSLAIYIPISILWVINLTWLKWVLVVLGAVLSGGVLVITFWPAVKEDTKNVAFIFIALIFIFHLALAAGFVLYFFNVPPAQTPQTTVAPVITKAPQVSDVKQLEEISKQVPKSASLMQERKPASSDTGNVDKAEATDKATVSKQTDKETVGQRTTDDKKENIDANRGQKLTTNNAAVEDKVAAEA